MFLEMTVAGLTLDKDTNMPIVILQDDSGENMVPIWIGYIEASAIATEIEQIEMARPMTHDLMRNILDRLAVKVVRIEVTDLRENTFFASIYLESGGNVMEIDARPSDSIALALRTGAKIFVAQRVVDLASQPRTEQEEAEADKWRDLLDSLSPEDLGKYKM